MQLIWVCWNWSEDLPPENWERGCFFFMLLLPNPIVGGGRGSEYFLWKPIIERTVIFWQLYWDDIGWNWEKNEKSRKSGKMQLKKYKFENLSDCCNFLPALLKGMTRENWWGWQNINCQLRSEEERGHHLVWRSGLLADAPLMAALTFCQMVPWWSSLYHMTIVILS